MPLLDQDIRLGYFYILGREPESRAIYDLYRDTPLDEFRAILTESEEGRDRLHRISALHQEPIYSRANIRAVCFIHLEKTGGTTFHDLMAGYYPAGRATSAHFSALHCLSLAEINQFEFISGHFDYHTTQFIPHALVKRVSLFRNPVDRLISFYRFHRAHPDPERDLDPFVSLARRLGAEAFFRHAVVRRSARTNNAYLRTFGATHYIDAADDEAEGDLAAMFNKAATRIRGLDGVGVTERLGAFIPAFCEALGLPPPGEIVDKQRTDDLPGVDPRFSPVDPIELTDGLVDAIEPLVRYDRPLYRLAQAEFDRRYPPRPALRRQA